MPTSAFAAVLRTHHPDHVDAQLFLRAINDTLFHVGHGEYQMSCAMMVFDVPLGELQFANGGLPFPCVFSRSTGQTSSVASRGPLLGKGSQFDCTETKVVLKPGDVLIWYSDGLLETRDAAGTQYGWKGLSASAQRNGQLPADQLCAALMADVRNYGGNGAQEDDLTVVVAEYVP